MGADGCHLPLNCTVVNVVFVIAVVIDIIIITISVSVIIIIIIIISIIVPSIYIYFLLSCCQAALIACSSFIVAQRSQVMT